MKRIEKAACLVVLAAAVGIGLPFRLVLARLMEHPAEYWRAILLLALLVTALLLSAVFSRTRRRWVCSGIMILSLLFAIAWNFRSSHYKVRKVSKDMLALATAKGPKKRILLPPYYLYRFYRGCTFLAESEELVPKDFSFIGRVSVRHDKDYSHNIGSAEEEYLRCFPYDAFADYREKNYYFIKTRSDLRLKCYQGVFVMLGKGDNRYVVPEETYRGLSTHVSDNFRNEAEKKESVIDVSEKE